jgi:predicted acyltransferase
METQASAVPTVKEDTGQDAAAHDGNGTRPEDAQSAGQAPDRADEDKAKQGTRRLASLDAFRGLTILGMLLVNNAALDTATPAQLTHAGWNKGLHFADMVFPWFLLIVGVAIPYAAASYKRRGLPPGKRDLKVFSRAVILVLLGCLVNSSLARRPLFDLGVLQLIGLAYLVAALLYELSPRRRLILAAVLLVGHWAAIRFLPVPGVGVGVFSESKNFINHLNEVYLDRYGLTGLISVVPTSALVLIGTVLGNFLRRESANEMRKAAHLMAGGLALAVVGWLWNLDLPFNKPVWTASYILSAAGWGTLVLGLFYLLIDVNGWRAWAFPLIVFGMNAITAFVAPILVKVHFLREWVWSMPDGSHLPLGEAFMNFLFTHAGRIAGGWLYTFSFILFWWAVLYWMYRKQVFWRV